MLVLDSIDRESSLFLYDTYSGKNIWSEIFFGYAEILGFYSDIKRIVLRNNKQIIILDATDGKEITSLKLDFNFVTCCYNETYKILGIELRNSYQEDRALIVDINTGQILSQKSGKRIIITSDCLKLINIMHDKVIVSSTINESLSFDLDFNTSFKEIDSAITLSQDNTLLVINDRRNNKIIIINIEKKTLVTLNVKPLSKAIQISPNNNFILLVGKSKKLEIFDIVKKQVIFTHQLNELNFSHPHFISNSILALIENNFINFYEFKTKKLLANIALNTLGTKAQFFETINNFLYCLIENYGAFGSEIVCININSVKTIAALESIKDSAHSSLLTYYIFNHMKDHKVISLTNLKSLGFNNLPSEIKKPVEEYDKLYETIVRDVTQEMKKLYTSKSRKFKSKKNQESSKN